MAISFETITREQAAKILAVEEGHYRPQGGKRIRHSSDVLLTFHHPKTASATEHISIEIKHLSAVTDQFKCRSFDTFHVLRSRETRRQPGTGTGPLLSVR